MKKQNPVLETLAKMNEEDVESNNELMKAQIEFLNAYANRPSLTVYILLAVFLGGIGAHDFYVGKTGKGLIKLAFCWTGIPAVVAIFNIIGALMNKQNFK